MFEVRETLVISMSYYPLFEEIITGINPKNLLQIRRSFRSVISHFTLFFISSIIVYALNMTYQGWVFPQWVPLIGGDSLRWLAIIPALTVLEILRKYHDDIYVFESHKVDHFEGRLSLKSTLPSVKYVDILAVRVKQDIWGRLLDFGNVELDTAASSAVELTLTGVRSPGEIAEIVDQFRRRSISKGAVDSPASSKKLQESKS